MSQPKIPKGTSRKSTKKSSKITQEDIRKFRAEEKVQRTLLIKSLLLKNIKIGDVARRAGVSTTTVQKYKKQLIADGVIASKDGSFVKAEVINPDETPYRQVQQRQTMEIIKDDLVDDLSNIALKSTKVVMDELQHATAKEAMSIADKAIHNLRLINGESTSNVAMVVGSLASGDPD